jgi:7-cyano-7-deazaguanine synthase
MTRPSAEVATRKTVVLLSGGVDSVTALYRVRRSREVIAALSFDYGAKHNRREIPFARWHCETLGIPHRICRLDFVAETFRSNLLLGGEPVPDGHYEEATMRQTVVPFRNGIMLSIAAGFAESAGAGELVIAAHAGDHAIYPDCRPAFMDAIAGAIRLGTYAGIEISRPFIGLAKSEIAALGHSLGIDYSRTWSCYKGGEKHCGACGTCVERREAFLLSGTPDPTAYGATPPLPDRPPAPV